MGKTNAGVSQGSILGPLFFLIYINNLNAEISSIGKFSADGTSLFSVVQNKNNSASQLNNDLRQVSDWAYAWKISFSPDPSKQAQEAIFSRKRRKQDYPPIYFNDISVTQYTVQKHIGLYLNEKLNYNNHIKEKLSKVYKGIGLPRISSINFQDKLLLQFIRHSYGHTSNMVILCMISQIMKCLLIKLRKQNMMQH